VEEEKVICQYCDYENDIERVYCEICKKKIRIERKSYAWLLILALLLLLFYLIIDNFNVYTDVKRIVYVDTPFSLVKEVTSTNTLEKNICQNRSFRFSTFGGNVDTFGVYARPNFRITNLEERWGYFKVNFSYIDESRFPYDIYGGMKLKENIASGKISIRDADFYSTNYEFYLGPGESMTITNMTRRINLSKKYWGIATIIEPKILTCSKKTEYINITENKTFTEYKKTEKTISIREYKKIREVIGVKNFMEWFIIVFLFCLIIVLILKIREERRNKNL